MHRIARKLPFYSVLANKFWHLDKRRGPTKSWIFLVRAASPRATCANGRFYYGRGTNARFAGVLLEYDELRAVITTAAKAATDMTERDYHG